MSILANQTILSLYFLTNCTILSLLCYSAIQLSKLTGNLTFWYKSRWKNAGKCLVLSYIYLFRYIIHNVATSSCSCIYAFCNLMRNEGKRVDIPPPPLSFSHNLLFVFHLICLVFCLEACLTPNFTTNQHLFPP
jgi:hypothetical protein